MRVVRTYLELATPAAFRPSVSAAPDLAVAAVGDPTPDLYRHLYRTVGKEYHWRDRWDWTDEEIRRHLGQPEITLHVGRRDGTVAGWYELRRVADDGSVEIAYFGLMPEQIGRGAGRTLLVRAVRDSWALGATRVWLHTCTLDHPHAMANYEARGFRPYKTEIYETDG
jgi:GNAT superfamily N-acetyltransferase